MTDESAQIGVQLQASHDRLLRVMNGAAAPAATASAFAKEWSVADVLSHLGSGAEIFGLIFERLASDEDAPVKEDFVAIWGRWNAKAPQEQVTDGLASDAHFVEVASRLAEDIHEVPAFGSVFSTADFLAMRLQEHVVHTWDVEVSADGAATLPAGHIPFLLGQLPSVAPRSARPVSKPRTVHVQVTSPDATFKISLDEETTLTRVEDGHGAQVTMPAECFARLVFGRLSAVRAVVSSPEEADVAAYLASVFVGY